MSRLAPMLLVALCACASGCRGESVDEPVRADAGSSDTGLPPGVFLRDGCPSGRGPEMANLGAFCMDRSEVTRSNFNAFLADPGKPAWPSTCGSPSYPAATTDSGDHPATNVTFCEAAVYCRWAGKQLCGARATDALTPEAALTASSMWSFACFGGESPHAYPYGETYERTRCLGERLVGSSPGTVPVNVAGTTCRSSVEPFHQVIDLSGSVAEWEDACSSADVTATCRVRGGSWNEMSSTNLRCDAARSEARGARLADVGFRCCYRP